MFTCGFGFRNHSGGAVMDLRVGFALLAGLVVAIAAAGLMVADKKSWPQALLAAGAAAAGTITVVLLL